MNGHVDVARLCLDYGADVDQWFGDRHENYYWGNLTAAAPPRGLPPPPVLTPLSVACQQKNVDLMQLLLERGARSEAVRDLSLQSACSQGSVNMTRFILDFTDDRCVQTYNHKGAPLVYGKSIVGLLRKAHVMSLFFNVIGHRLEHPGRQRLGDLVPRIASYLTPRAQQA